MITLTILLIALLVLVGTILTAVLASGLGILLTLGDLIVFALIVCLFVNLFRQSKKKKEKKEK